MLNLKSKKIILASNSPRRKELLSALKIPFEVKTQNVDENYSPNMDIEKVAEYLAVKKATAIQLQKNDIVISADTTVLFQGKIINKPTNKKNAIQILKKISGNKHKVITGVCLKSIEKIESFSEITYVYFQKISNQEIKYYVDNFKPFDKAGSYGIQEWIGLMGIHKIEGCYYNIVGLPTSKLYKKIMDLI